MQSFSKIYNHIFHDENPCGPCKLSTQAKSLVFIYLFIFIFILLWTTLHGKKHNLCWEKICWLFYFMLLLSLSCKWRWLDGSLREHLGKGMGFLAQIVSTMTIKLVWSTNNFPPTLKEPCQCCSIALKLIILDLTFESGGIVMQVHGVNNCYRRALHKVVVCYLNTFLLAPTSIDMKHAIGARWLASPYLARSPLPQFSCNPYEDLNHHQSEVFHVHLMVI